jgi:hypothetical protein
MNRRLRIGCLRWVLPLALGQLLLPLGVMPGKIQAHATLIMCSTHAVSAAETPGTDQSAPTTAHKDSICPFAAVALASPNASHTPIARQEDPSTLTPVATAQSNPPAGPRRIRLDTGPPTRLM